MVSPWESTNLFPSTRINGSFRASGFSRGRRGRAGAAAAGAAAGGEAADGAGADGVAREDGALVGVAAAAGAGAVCGESSAQAGQVNTNTPISNPAVNLIVIPALNDKGFPPRAHHSSTANAAQHSRSTCAYPLATAHRQLACNAARLQPTVMIRMARTIHRSGWQIHPFVDVSRPVTYIIGDSPARILSTGGLTSSVDCR
jgi:hypothetical protein